MQLSCICHSCDALPASMCGAPSRSRLIVPSSPSIHASSLVTALARRLRADLADRPCTACRVAHGGRTRWRRVRGLDRPARTASSRPQRRVRAMPRIDCRRCSAANAVVLRPASRGTPVALSAARARAHLLSPTGADTYSRSAPPSSRACLNQNIRRRRNRRARARVGMRGERLHT